MRRTVRKGYVKHTWYPSRDNFQWIYDRWYEMLREGIRVDVSSVVRAILDVLEEDIQDRNVLKAVARDAVETPRHEPRKLACLVEERGDAPLWDIKAYISREYGSSVHISDVVDAAIRHVRKRYETEEGFARKFQEKVIAATPAEDGRGKRRIIPQA